MDAFDLVGRCCIFNYFVTPCNDVKSAVARHCERSEAISLHEVVLPAQRLLRRFTPRNDGL